jgi:hypothetical protein
MADELMGIRFAAVTQDESDSLLIAYPPELARTRRNKRRRADRCCV